MIHKYFASVVAEFGFSDKRLKLHNIESFVLPGGWHLIYHFVCLVDSEPQEHENVNQYKWVNAQELEAMTDIAHGKWEIGVGKKYLHSAE